MPRGKAEAPAPADRGPKPPPGEVAPRLVGAGALPAHQHRVVEVLGGPERLDQAGPLGPAPRAALLGELDPRSVREVADRVREVQVLTALNVGEDVTALAAPKAVPQARRRVDLEGGALLAVEGTAAPELLAALTQLHGLSHELHEVRCLADPLLVLVGDHESASPLR